MYDASKFLFSLYLYSIVSVYDRSCFICVAKNVKNVHVIQGQKRMSFFNVLFLSFIYRIFIC